MDKELTELQIQLRKNVIEDLHLLASTKEQLEFQRRVPFVNISNELTCGWFDDSYHPADETFCGAFSEAELKTLAKFNEVFDHVRSSFEEPHMPEIQALIQTPQWKRAVKAAAKTLKVFL
jgi:hypothetical protein